MTFDQNKAKNYTVGSVAVNFAKSKNSKKAYAALVVGAETLSRILDWNDRGTCILFADGAGAVILEASEEPGILSTHIHADGDYTELLTTNGSISSTPDKFASDNIKIEMRGNEEVSHIRGVQVTKSEYPAYTPAFDVTPNELITAIITDKKLYKPPYDL